MYWAVYNLYKNFWYVNTLNANKMWYVDKNVINFNLVTPYCTAVYFLKFHKA